MNLFFALFLNNFLKVSMIIDQTELSMTKLFLLLEWSMLH